MVYRIEAYEIGLTGCRWVKLESYHREENAYSKLTELEEKYEDACVRVVNTDLAAESEGDTAE